MITSPKSGFNSRPVHCG